MVGSTDRFEPRTGENEMYTLFALAAFGSMMAVISHVLRAKERAGDFDPQSPSSAARPGLRLFFDFSSEGWRGDGVNQRPPRRELLRRD